MSWDAGKTGALARKIWLIYALATVTAALALLAAYVNAYDDYDIGPRLRGLGRFTRQATLALGFPLSPASEPSRRRPLERRLWLRRRKRTLRHVRRLADALYRARRADRLAALGGRSSVAEG